jgi:thiol-disulfide isomerase/thioredoxin
MARARKSNTNAKTVLNMHSVSEVGNMNSLLENGPSVVLIYSTTCPHCVSYMPIWEELCTTPNRSTNMISMEASVYQNTPMAQKKPVTGVPTVLHVNAGGEITEIADPRNKQKMTDTITERPSPLRPLPGTMKGGSNASNPWFAFLHARKRRSTRSNRSTRSKTQKRKTK